VKPATLACKAAYNVAVVGAGAVGVEMLRILRQRKFPVAQWMVLARSARALCVDGVEYAVRAVAADALLHQDIVFFAGTEGEKGAAATYAKGALRAGAVVIDNGADFRMDAAVPLVVPEANGEDLERHQGLIANPNCSTIQMVMALAPVHRLYGLKRIVVSSYQAASGAGRKAMEELKIQTEAVLAGCQAQPPEILPHPLAFNVIPQIGPVGEWESRRVGNTQSLLSHGAGGTND